MRAVRKNNDQFAGSLDSLGALSTVFLDSIVKEQNLDYLEHLCNYCQHMMLNYIWFTKQSTDNKRKLLTIYQLCISYSAKLSKNYKSELLLIEQQIKQKKEQIKQKRNYIKKHRSHVYDMKNQLKTRKLKIVKGTYQQYLIKIKQMHQLYQYQKVKIMNEQEFMAQLLLQQQQQVMNIHPQYPQNPNYQNFNPQGYNLNHMNNAVYQVPNQQNKQHFNNDQKSKNTKNTKNSPNDNRSKQKQQQQQVKLEELNSFNVNEFDSFNNLKLQNNSKHMSKINPTSSIIKNIKKPVNKNIEDKNNKPFEYNIQTSNTGDSTKNKQHFKSNISFKDSNFGRKDDLYNSNQQNGNIERKIHFTQENDVNYSHDQKNKNLYNSNQGVGLKKSHFNQGKQSSDSSDYKDITKSNFGQSEHKAHFQQASKIIKPNNKQKNLYESNQGKGERKIHFTQRSEELERNQVKSNIGKQTSPIKNHFNDINEGQKNKDVEKQANQYVTYVTQSNNNKFFISGKNSQDNRNSKQLPKSIKEQSEDNYDDDDFQMLQESSIGAKNQLSKKESQVAKQSDVSIKDSIFASLPKKQLTLLPNAFNFKKSFSSYDSMMIGSIKQHSFLNNKFQNNLLQQQNRKKLQVSDQNNIFDDLIDMPLNSIIARPSRIKKQKSVRLQKKMGSMILNKKIQNKLSDSKQQNQPKLLIIQNQLQSKCIKKKSKQQLDIQITQSMTLQQQKLKFQKYKSNHAEKSDEEISQILQQNQQSTIQNQKQQYQAKIIALLRKPQEQFQKKKQFSIDIIENQLLRKVNKRSTEIQNWVEVQKLYTALNKKINIQLQKKREQNKLKIQNKLKKYQSKNNSQFDDLTYSKSIGDPSLGIINNLSKKKQSITQQNKQLEKKQQDNNSKNSNIKLDKKESQKQKNETTINYEKESNKQNINKSNVENTQKILGKLQEGKKYDIENTIDNDLRKNKQIFNPVKASINDDQFW